MDVGLKMTGCRVCSTEESAQGTWVSMASVPCPACPPQPEERTQTSHQCGQSEKWQAPRCGQIGRSQSPHSLCQAPSDIKALTPVQGSGPAAVLPRLYWGHRGFSGRYRCRTYHFVNPHLSLTTEVSPRHTVASGTWHSPPGHQEAVGCDVLDAQLQPFLGS